MYSSWEKQYIEVVEALPAVVQEPTERARICQAWTSSVVLPVRDITVRQICVSAHIGREYVVIWFQSIDSNMYRE